MEYLDTLWKHIKTGVVYKIVGECILEASNEPAFLYQATETGFLEPLPVWARSKKEFLDGRFVKETQ